MNIKKFISLTSFTLVALLGSHSHAAGSKTDCEDNWALGNIDIIKASSSLTSVLDEVDGSAIEASITLCGSDSGCTTSPITTAVSDLEISKYYEELNTKITDCHDYLIREESRISQLADGTPKDNALSKFNTEKLLLDHNLRIQGRDALTIIRLFDKSFEVLTQIDSKSRFKRTDLYFLNALNKKALSDVLIIWSESQNIEHLAFEEIELLLELLPPESANNFKSLNSKAIVELIEEKEARLRNERISAQLVLKNETEEFNQLIVKQTLLKLEKDDRERLNILYKKLNKSSSNPTSEIPLTAFGDYPVYSNRLYVGTSMVAENELPEDPRTTVGYFFYAQPKIGENRHHMIDVGISSINTSLTTTDDSGSETQESETEYSIDLDYTFFYALKNLELKEGFYHGPVISSGYSVFEYQNDSETELLYLPNIDLGYRFASSPEQYIETKVGACVKPSGSADVECEARIKLDLRSIISDPFGWENGGAFQIGVGLDLKTNKNDTFDDKVELSLRYRTSFGALYNALSVN